MTNTIGQEAYNRFNHFDEFSYNCISYLMQNNEMIWKLLKYDDPDAWCKPNLSLEEKGELVYRGQPDGTGSKVFLDAGIPDVWTHEVSILRVYPYGARPINRTLGTVTMCFETYSHFRINTLSNYKVRTAMIVNEVLETLNGKDIGGGLGYLFFDQMRDLKDLLSQAGQQPFKGYSVYLSTNSG